MRKHINRDYESVTACCVLTTPPALIVAICSGLGMVGSVWFGASMLLAFMLQALKR
jgi:hypothetical protein